MKVPSSEFIIFLINGMGVFPYQQKSTVELLVHFPADIMHL